MPYVADPIPTRDFRLDMLLPEQSCYVSSHRAHGVMPATTHVEHLPCCLGYFQGQAASLDDIRDADEVTLLITILVDERGLPAQQARCEDGQHAGIRI